MQILTSLLCIQNRSDDENFDLFMKKLLQLSEYSNNERSQFLRHKAIQCLEEIEKHLKINMSKYVVGEPLSNASNTSTTSQSTPTEDGNINLLESFKNSNDWVSPAYSSLVRTILIENNVYSDLENFKNQLKQVANAMWEIKD